MYRFPIPVGREDYETAPKENRIAIPYAMLTSTGSRPVAGENLLSNDAPSGNRLIIMPLAAAEESRFIHSAVEGLQGLPGCEGALFASSLDTSPSLGGGGGIRTQWKDKVETTASRLYKSYVDRFVLTASDELLESDDDGGEEQHMEEALQTAMLLDDVEEEEAFYGQTLANRRYPPASPPTATSSVGVGQGHGDEEDESLYTCFCSNGYPKMPIFPLNTIPNLTLEHLTHAMMGRALFNTTLADGPCTATREVLQSLGNSEEGQNQAVDLMIAAAFLQV